MCKTVREGGQRCAAHTRPRYERATPGTEDWDRYAASYASTPSGQRQLTMELAAAEPDSDHAAALAQALKRGAQIRERDAAAYAAIQEGRSAAPRRGKVKVAETAAGRRWTLAGHLHREDGPAIEFADGGRHWYRDGLLHREDGPAIESADGTRQWAQRGRLHREDGPAVERADGTSEWWVNGKRAAPTA